jgi:hypothetical protein
VAFKKTHHSASSRYGRSGHSIKNGNSIVGDQPDALEKGLFPEAYE